MTTPDRQTLDVALGARSYPIRIGAGALQDAGPLLAGDRTRRAVIVTNATVAAHWLRAVARQPRGARHREPPRC